MQKVASVLALLASTDAHGMMTCPTARNYRADVAQGNPWTGGMVGIAAPFPQSNANLSPDEKAQAKAAGFTDIEESSGAYNYPNTNGDGGQSFAPLVMGPYNVPNENANIGAAATSASASAPALGWQPNSRGVCGDIRGREAFNSAPGSKLSVRQGNTPDLGFVDMATGPATVGATYVAGAHAELQIKLTAYHDGWFEFRAAKPDLVTGVVTQDALNQHVLKIHPRTPGYEQVIAYSQMSFEKRCKSASDPDGGNAAKYPWGTCCNTGGNCTAARENRERYVITEGVAPTTIPEHLYNISLDLRDLPEDLIGDRVTIQWSYVTANSPSAYPEAFWSCADVSIKPEGYAGATGCASEMPDAVKTLSDWFYDVCTDGADGIYTCTKNTASQHRRLDPFMRH